MKRRELLALGIPAGDTLNCALRTCAAAARAGHRKRGIQRSLEQLVRAPREYLDDAVFGELAELLTDFAARCLAAEERAAQPAPWQQWGEDIAENAISQMERACRLPVAVRGALMPDAHLGYGLPIGGVLATDNAVIPYAVGVDIACRMKMTVLDIPPEQLRTHPERFVRAIEKQTRFGVGAAFGDSRERRDHPVMERDWSVSPVTARLRDRAWKQLGTSGSGNHFVEFGELEVRDARAGTAPGEYLALLSHSGSRGTGAAVAAHYSRLALDSHPELPKELRHLAWLDLATSDGAEYWAAMELMGEYAAANHACIHEHIVDHLRAEVIARLENHHNFAWKEVHDGREVVVHRKGATPATDGVLGIIPGSMADPAYIVRGRGRPESLNSASHGAGRALSRKEAHRTLDWKMGRELLRRRGVTLLSAGLDELPLVYKNIDEVMAAQGDLVEPLARFQPRIVKMAPAGERPED